MVGCGFLPFMTVSFLNLVFLRFVPTCSFPPRFPFPRSIPPSPSFLSFFPLFVLYFKRLLPFPTQDSFLSFLRSRYLTLRYQEAHNEFESPTIFLTWIPNSTIHRNPAISDVHLGGNSPRSAKFKRCLRYHGGRLS